MLVPLIKPLFINKNIKNAIKKGILRLMQSKIIFFNIICLVCTIKSITKKVPFLQSYTRNIFKLLIEYLRRWYKKLKKICIVCYQKYSLN